MFNRMIGKKTNEQIEEFIKENIGIKEYSFHQVQTFIKLFISQFNKLNGKLKFTTQKKDMTKNFIEYFSNPPFIKYFILLAKYVI